MRKFLFMGLTVEDKKWVFGDVTHFAITNSDGSIVERMFVDGVKVKSDTVRQYIGRKDENGVPIFSGMIVDVYSWREDEKFDRYIVRYDDHWARYDLLTSNGHNYNFSDKDSSLGGRVVVVGEIFNHHELLLSKRWKPKKDYMAMLAARPWEV